MEQLSCRWKISGNSYHLAKIMLLKSDGTTFMSRWNNFHVVRQLPFILKAVVYFEIYYAAKYGFNVVNML